MSEPAAWSGSVSVAFFTRFGSSAAVEEGFGPLTVDVPLEHWVEAATLARDELGCAFFDFLTGVDELDDGIRLVLHVAGHAPGAVRHLVLRTLVTDTVASLAGVWAGARWHERETAEMFGVTFTGTDDVPLDLEGLLLPEGFEGHPLRKDFVLASRVAKPWPGAKEPGESDAAHGAAATRRRVRPPGVPEDWPVETVVPEEPRHEASRRARSSPPQEPPR